MSTYLDMKIQEWQNRLKDISRPRPSMMIDFIREVMPGHRYKKVKAWDRQVIDEGNVTIIKASSNKELVEAIFDHVTIPDEARDIQHRNPIQYIKEKKLVLTNRVQEAVSEFYKATGALPEFEVEEDGTVVCRVKLTM